MNIVHSLGGKPQGRKFAIYVPSKDKDGRAIDHQRWMNETMNFLTETFGRCTAMPRLEGTWSDRESRKLLHETTDIVYSFVTEEFLQHQSRSVRSFLIRLGCQTGQKEVGFEYDGVFCTLSLDEALATQC